MGIFELHAARGDRRITADIAHRHRRTVDSRMRVRRVGRSPVTNSGCRVLADDVRRPMVVLGSDDQVCATRPAVAEINGQSPPWRWAPAPWIPGAA
jgi:hypothetical protein